MLSCSFSAMTNHIQHFSKNVVNSRLCVIVLLCQFQICEISGSKCGTVSPVESRIEYSAFRIGGGDVAQKGDYPFIAALYQTNEQQFFCGGTLISAKNVLTGTETSNI